jgi:hypothetical protein
MRFRGLDNDGDWVFGKGRNSYLTGNEALMMNIKTRLLSFLNDCFFDTDAGIDWWNLLGEKDHKSILASVQRVVLRSSNVKKIVDIQYNLNRYTRKFSITLTVEFANGEIITDTVEVLNAE